MTSNIKKYFAPGGILSTALPQFKPRSEQTLVAEAIEKALARQNGIALIEAGTGVGKTMAYLLPALQHATPDKKIIISTHTLALQGQLADKDVPLVQSCWPRSFKSTVVKGRGNYLCLMEQDAVKEDLWTIGDPQFIEVNRWSGTTQSGDMAELPFMYRGWSEIRANSDTCKGQECRYYDRCFYYSMRRAAQEASILLVNHALFFSDLAMRAGGEPDAKLLPDYSFVVFDEAHHLESAAAGAFGVAFSSARLPILMDRIHRASRHLDMHKTDLQEIERQSETLFTPFLQGGRSEFMVEQVLGRQGLQDARKKVLFLSTLLDHLAVQLQKQETHGQQSVKDHLDGLRRQCIRAKEDLNLLFMTDHENYLRWGAYSAGGVRRGPVATLNWTPISVAPLLADALWKEPRPVGAALLSATLSTDGGFDYIRKRLGIPAAEGNGVTETIVGSPFDYQKRCLMYIPSRLPVPSEEPGYLYLVVEEIIALIEASRGGAFILFTSYRALNATYDHLVQADLPYPLLRQGEMPNARLVEAFKEQKDAVLLGTQSFWEGVDVPGTGLRLVVIDRIPFSVPDNPLHKARVDSLTRAGGDWFQDFALPQAQLRMKQGFGRLIRTQGDWGVVAVLDTRLIRKSYGLSFLRFLPHAKRTSELAEVQRFYTTLGAAGS